MRTAGAEAVVPHPRFGPAALVGVDSSVPVAPPRLIRFGGGGPEAVVEAAPALDGVDGSTGAVATCGADDSVAAAETAASADAFSFASDAGLSVESSASAALRRSGFLPVAAAAGVGAETASAIGAGVGGAAAAGADSAAAAGGADDSSLSADFFDFDFTLAFFPALSGDLVLASSIAVSPSAAAASDGLTACE